MDGAQFIIFFEDPFWVGIYDSFRGDRRYVNRVVFGAEPTNAELLAFLRDRFGELVDAAKESAAENPRSDPRALFPMGARRGMRAAARDQGRKPSKSLHACHEAFERAKAESRAEAVRRRTADAEDRFILRREKKKAARRGK